MQTEEYLDLVNENDEVLESRPRSQIYAENLSNFRVINVFLINSQGQLWIPRRTAHKAVYPLALDFSAAGHVSSGDTYDSTFAKEVSEEINIDIATVPHRMLGYFKPKSLGERPKQFMQVYEIQSDAVPQYNPDDFIEYFWLTPREVVDRIERGDKAKSDLPLFIKHFYL